MPIKSLSSPISRSSALSLAITAVVVLACKISSATKESISVKSYAKSVRNLFLKSRLNALHMAELSFSVSC